MTRSNEIPANVIPYVRAGSHAALADAGIELGAAEARVLKDSDREQRWWADPAGRRKRHGELLDLIGRTEEDNTEAVEMRAYGHADVLAVTEALEWFTRDRPGVGTAEIEAFCLDAGLAC
jgi:hypothetical protein